VKICTN